MPPPYVLTVRDQIFYEHAVLMSRVAFGNTQQSFIHDRFKLLRDGRLRISDTVRQWQDDQELPRECTFCGSKEDLTTDLLIPKSRGGSDSPDNSVLACHTCTSIRGGRRLFEWLGLLKKDSLPPVTMGKYLMLLLEAHEAAGTLGVSKEDIGGFCHACPLPGICEEWATVGKLTSFCLENVLP